VSFGSVFEHGDHEVLPWLGGARLRMIAGTDATAGTLSVLQIEADDGYVAALHRHRNEDELFLVLDGAMRVQVGPDAWDVRVGQAAFLPRGVPHSFRISSDGSRLLHISTPGGLDAYFRAASALLSGDRPEAEDIPPATLARITELAASYGIEYL